MPISAKRARPNAKSLPALSRREQQIMDVVYAHGEATAQQVLSALPDPPSYSAVRALLKVLETKGHLSHEVRGTTYVYRPMVPARDAREPALRRLVKTFFAGSAANAVATLLDVSRSELSDGDLERLSRMIEDARKAGR